MRYFVTLITAICLVGFSPVTIGETLRIVTMALAPAGYKENGKAKGVAYEIANEIAKKTNMPYTNTLKPYGRAVHELKSGKADLSIMLYNTSLDGKAIPLAPVFLMSTIAIGKKGINLKGLSELSAKKVGVIRSSNFLDSELVKDMNLVSIKDYKQAVKMLNAGRIHAFIGVDLGVYFHIKNLGLERKDFGQPYIVNSQKNLLYVSAKFTDQETINNLKKATEQMAADGTIDSIVEKYLGK